MRTSSSLLHYFILIIINELIIILILGGLKKFSYHNLKSYIQRGYGLSNLLWGYGDPLPLTTKFLYFSIQVNVCVRFVKIPSKNSWKIKIGTDPRPQWPLKGNLLTWRFCAKTLKKLSKDVLKMYLVVGHPKYTAPLAMFVSISVG